VDGFLILKGHDTQVSALTFFQRSSKSIPIIFLSFRFDRILKDPFAPFLFDVWTFSQDLVFKIEGVAIFFHLDPGTT